MKKAFILSLLALACLAVTAQNKIGKIPGIVKDAECKLVALVTVVLQRSFIETGIDKTVVTVNVSQEEQKLIGSGN